MKNKVPSFLLERPSSNSFIPGKGTLTRSFIDKGVHSLAEVIKTGYIQGGMISGDTLFQKIDARVKVLFLLGYIILVSVKKDLLSEGLIGAFVFILTLLSRLDIFTLYKRILLFTFLFGFCIALPSALNIITKGEILFPILHFTKSHRFWIYQIPEVIGVTREGLSGVLLLTLRVMNSLSLSFFVLYTTSFTDIIKALKVLKVPDSFLMILTLTYKYVFIFAKTIEDMYLAKKSRLAGKVNNIEARRWIVGRIAFLFRKSQRRCEDIFKAMLGRGFSNNITIYGVKKLQVRDWIMSASLLLIGLIFLWI